MVGSNFNYQFIDWQHGDIGEGFDHLGTLSATVFTPNITLGLTDWWNVTLSQVIGRRYMTWEVPENTTVHHRDEGSESGFDNAIGGYLGDSRIIARFLALNTGRGPGLRLFLGGGIGIPSKNSLISDPFFLNGDEVKPHRHFSMSEGIYKAIFETQFFVKRIKNPVFAGGTFSIEEPLGESEYGYKGSRLVDFSLTAFSKK